MNGSGHGRRPPNRHGETDTLGLVYQSLSSEYRRQILAIIGAEGGVSIPDVVGQLEEEVGARQHAIQRSLKHVHLPKLERAGLVDVNREHERVGLTDEGEKARRLNECACELFGGEASAPG